VSVKPHRRRRVEPPDLAVAELNFANEVSDPDDQLDHAEHVFSEPVASIKRAFALG
jgi:hypothetical protein